MTNNQRIEILKENLIKCTNIVRRLIVIIKNIEKQIIIGKQIKGQLLEDIKKLERAR